MHDVSLYEGFEVFGLKRKTSFRVLVMVICITLLIIVPSFMLYIYFKVGIDIEVNVSTIMNTIITYVLVLVTASYATILFWKSYTDVPQLEIQTKEINISKRKDFCEIAIPILNDGPRDAKHWRSYIQIFNQKCGNKVYDNEVNKKDSVKCGEIESFGISKFCIQLPPFTGDFVAKIATNAHKSPKDAKVIKYHVNDDYGTIQPECEILIIFKLKYFFKKYRNDWDIPLFEEGLGEFGDLSTIKRVVEMLGQTADENAVKPLVECLWDADICEDAARALGDLQSERAVEPLLKCLRKYNFTGQLGQIFEKTDGRNYVEDLIRILEEEDRSGDYIRRIVVVLGMVGKNTDEETVGKIQNVYIKLLKEVEKDIREHEISNPISGLVKDICNVLGDIGFTEESLNAVEKIDDNIIGNKKKLVGKIKRRIRKRKRQNEQNENIKPI